MTSALFFFDLFKYNLSTFQLWFDDCNRSKGLGNDFDIQENEVEKREK